MKKPSKSFKNNSFCRTQGLKDSGTQGLRDSGTQGLKDSLQSSGTLSTFSIQT